jgi:hypothetical protein
MATLNISMIWQCFCDGSLPPRDFGKRLLDLLAFNYQPDDIIDELENLTEKEWVDKSEIELYIAKLLKWGDEINPRTGQKRLILQYKQGHENQLELF